MAVSPSDTAPALIALDAEMVIRSAGGERVVKAEDYFVGPAIDITRMTVLRPGELLTAIRIPATWAGAQFYFEKVRDRQRVGLPAGERGVGDEGRRATTIQAARLAVGAVAATAAAADGGGSGGGGQAAQRRDGDDGRANWRSRARRRCATTATRFR